MEFEWDEAKAASNLTKHGVSFEEALTVFDDPFALIFDDEEHSETEPREIIIGYFKPATSPDRLLHRAFVSGQDHQRTFRNKKGTSGL